MKSRTARSLVALAAATTMALTGCSDDDGVGTGTDAGQTTDQGTGGAGGAGAGGAGAGGGATGGGASGGGYGG